ncbi:hypothetical protein MKW98_027925 [Papaver atlanticum]|uniref:Uncharacterized protein n=1 Tax=Papaver atlanticum TaxID=357466 RepID=A0AAD4XAS5_9MAGN|nr:hypothetical protein MKW98_027925 [Papaver atlanticum]
MMEQAARLRLEKQATKEYHQQHHDGLENNSRRYYRSNRTEIRAQPMSSHKRYQIKRNHHDDVQPELGQKSHRDSNIGLIIESSRTRQFISGHQSRTENQQDNQKLGCLNIFPKNDDGRSHFGAAISDRQSRLNDVEPEAISEIEPINMMMFNRDRNQSTSESSIAATILNWQYYSTRSINFI